MPRLHITTKAKTHLKKAKEYRKNENMSWQLAKSFLNSGKTRTARFFGNDAMESRNMAKQNVKMARQSLFPGYTTGKRVVRNLKLKTRKFFKKAREAARKL